MERLPYSTLVPGEVALNVSLLRTRPDGIAIVPGFYSSFALGALDLPRRFILKINQNAHFFHLLDHFGYV